MFEVLFTYLECTAPLTKDNKTFIQSILIPKKLVKGEFFLREGEISKYGAFVAKGFLRSYIIDNKGKEHIVQFAPEN